MYYILSKSPWLYAMYNVARVALHVVKAEKRSVEHINIQDGGPQEHQ